MEMDGGTRGNLPGAPIINALVMLCDHNAESDQIELRFVKSRECGHYIFRLPAAMFEDAPRYGVDDSWKGFVNFTDFTVAFVTEFLHVGRTLLYCSWRCVFEANTTQQVFVQYTRYLRCLRLRMPGLLHDIAIFRKSIGDVLSGMRATLRSVVPLASPSTRQYTTLFSR